MFGSYDFLANVFEASAQMNEVWLLIGFISLVLVGLSIVLYPLRKSGLRVMVLLPLFICLIGLGYWHWGAWPAWTTYLNEAEKQRRAEVMLKSIHDPAELITQLKDRLNQQPDSARGWYLLGRLYVSQALWHNASEAYAKAHTLEPDNIQITVNYAQSLWQENQQLINPAIKALLKTVLDKNADDPDALAMLALDAFKRHDYHTAIEYWQHLLTLAPPQSEDAQAIRKAIAKAQQMLSGSVVE